MKFIDELDARTFLMEIRAFDKVNEAGVDYEPTEEELDEFLKLRSPLVKKMKDRRRSSAQKANWRQNRHKMLKAIKAFHKSVAGKRFHKQLGRFLATRIFRRKANEDASADMLIAKRETLKGLNSAKQHLLVELGYFHQLEEQVQFEEYITDYAYPRLRALEEKVINDDTLDDDDVIFLMDLVETNSVVQSFAKKTGKTFDEIEDVWNTISDEWKKSGIDKEDDKFFPVLVARLKKMLKIK